MSRDLFGAAPSSSSLAKNKQVIPDPLMRPGPPIPAVDYSYKPGDMLVRGRFDPPEPTAAETWLRHCEWLDDRARVRRALISAQVPGKRLMRFDSCGAEGSVEWSPSIMRHRVRCFCCGDRFCRPCSRARGGRLRRTIAELANGEELRFATFARATAGESLVEAFNRLYAAFRRLRTDVGWLDHVKGGVGIVEVKRGEGAHHWHPHFHCLLTGRYWPQEGFSRAWLGATGDSPVVWISLVRDGNRGAGYVCKYVSKGISPAVLQEDADLRDTILALRGRRLFTAVGDWYGRVREAEGPSVTDWRCVGSVDRLVFNAKRGDTAAAGVLRSLEKDRALARLIEPTPTGEVE